MDAEIENADVAGAPVEVAALAIRVVLALDAGVVRLVAVIGAASPPGALRRVGAIRAGVAAADAKAAVRRLNEGVATCSRVAAPGTKPGRRLACSPAKAGGPAGEVRAVADFLPVAVEAVVALRVVLALDAVVEQFAAKLGEVALHRRSGLTESRGLVAGLLPIAELTVLLLAIEIVKAFHARPGSSVAT